MGRFTEKQMLWATIAVSALLVVAFGLLWYMDYQAVNAADVESDPNAAEIADPEEWGEKRRIQEIQREMEAAQAEARLIPKREQDVIVYREIVTRDSAILPDSDEVNRMALTIDDFVRQSGVYLRQVSDLSVKPGSQAISRMPIKLQVSGTFEEFLKFVNLFETLDRMVNVQAFGVSAGRGRPDGKLIHDIALDLETYIYNSSAGLAKPVEIQNYERRKDDPVIQKLVRQQKAARVEKYQLKPRINRRDPLLDPRRERNATTDGVTDAAQFEEQKQLVDTLKFEIQNLRSNTELEEQYVQEHKYVAYTQIKAIIDATVARLKLDIEQADPKVTIAELRDVFNDEVLTPFLAIAGKRDDNAPPIVLTQVDIRKFVEEMRKATEERAYETALKTYEQFEAFIQGRQLAEDTGALMAEMRRIYTEAKVMLEFDRLDTRVTGKILLPNNRSTVIINGKARRAADAVDAAGRCKIVEIHHDRIVFELDGFQIEKRLDEK